jgi:hypothetical protein
MPSEYAVPIIVPPNIPAAAMLRKTAGFFIVERTRLNLPGLEADFAFFPGESSKSSTDATDSFVSTMRNTSTCLWK